MTQLTDYQDAVELSLLSILDKNIGEFTKEVRGILMSVEGKRTNRLWAIFLLERLQDIEIATSGGFGRSPYMKVIDGVIRILDEVDTKSRGDSVMDIPLWDEALPSYLSAPTPSRDPTRTPIRIVR